MKVGDELLVIFLLKIKENIILSQIPIFLYNPTYRLTLF